MSTENIWATIVGENMKYLVFDHQRRPLACLLFGSAAWSSAARDDFSLFHLEPFVEVDTCYRTANWKYVGVTNGRGRNDRHTSLHVPVKAVYLYPLAGGDLRC
jgi:hypothetical protein